MPHSEDDDYIPTQIVEEKLLAPPKPKKVKKAAPQYKTDHYSMQF